MTIPFQALPHSSVSPFKHKSDTLPSDFHAACSIERLCSTVLNTLKFLNKQFGDATSTIRNPSQINNLFT